MIIRPLTDTEKTASKKEAKEANEYISAAKKELAKQIDGLIKKRRLGEVSRLRVQRDALKLVTGLPVIIQADRESIVTNYEALSAFNRKIGAKNWRRSARFDIVNGDPVLTLFYEEYGSRNRGWAEFYQLRHHQVELLKNLPIIELIH